MRGRTAWLCALALVAMTGCPEQFGKHGRVQRAVHKDMLERAQERTCPREVYEQVCAGDKQQSAECLEQCGG